MGEVFINKPMFGNKYEIGYISSNLGVCHIATDILLLYAPVPIDVKITKMTMWTFHNISL